MSVEELLKKVICKDCAGIIYEYYEYDGRKLAKKYNKNKLNAILIEYFQYNKKNDEDFSLIFNMQMAIAIGEVENEDYAVDYIIEIYDKRLIDLIVNHQTFRYYFTANNFLEILSRENFGYAYKIFSKKELYDGEIFNDNKLIKYDGNMKFSHLYDILILDGKIETICKLKEFERYIFAKEDEDEFSSDKRWIYCGKFSDIFEKDMVLRAHKFGKMEIAKYFAYKLIDGIPENVW